jgi:transcriptional regulator with XRE-family HTH domain
MANVDPEDVQTLLEETGRRIREKRLAQKLSQVQVAEMAGVTQPIVSRMERNRGDHTIRTLYRIFYALESVEEIPVLEKLRSKGE